MCFIFLLSLISWNRFNNYCSTGSFVQLVYKLWVNMMWWGNWDFFLLHSGGVWSQRHVALCPAAAAQLSSSSHKWCFVAPSIYFITRAPDILGSVLIFGESWDAATEGGGSKGGRLTRWPPYPLWNIAQVQKHNSASWHDTTHLNPCSCVPLPSTVACLWRVCLCV